MLDKEKLKKCGKILILITLIILLLIFIRRTFSRYETSANFKRDLDVAFFVIDNSFQSDIVAITDLSPSETPYQYSFTISNFDNTQRCETAMEYEIVINATTNLPLSYSLTKNGTQCETTQEIIKDSSGTYYKKITVSNTQNNKLEFGYSQNETDTFILYVTFPEEQNNSAFSDLIDVINIELNAKQII